MSKRLVEQKWYLLDQPWCHSHQGGTLILAGSNDPHIGVCICDTDDIEESYDTNEAREIAQHIVDLHNQSLTPTKAE